MRSELRAIAKGLNPKKDCTLAFRVDEDVFQTFERFRRDLGVCDRSELLRYVFLRGLERCVAALEDEQE